MGSHPMDVHVPGHEGIGLIVKLGSSVGNRRHIGQRVGVKWINETCRACDICQQDETSCPEQHNSGRDRAGTLQEYVTVSAEQASPIPDGVPSHVAAPLLCGTSLVFCLVELVLALLCLSVFFHRTRTATDLTAAV